VCARLHAEHGDADAGKSINFCVGKEQRKVKLKKSYKNVEKVCKNVGEYFENLK